MLRFISGHTINVINQGILMALLDLECSPHLEGALKVHVCFFTYVQACCVTKAGSPQTKSQFGLVTCLESLKNIACQSRGKIIIQSCQYSKETISQWISCQAAKVV